MDSLNYRASLAILTTVQHGLNPTFLFSHNGFFFSSKLARKVETAQLAWKK